MLAKPALPLLSANSSSADLLAGLELPLLFPICDAVPALLVLLLCASKPVLLIAAAAAAAAAAS